MKPRCLHREDQASEWTQTASHGQVTRCHFTPKFLSCWERGAGAVRDLSPRGSRTDETCQFPDDFNKARLWAGHSSRETASWSEVGGALPHSMTHMSFQLQVSGGHHGGGNPSQTGQDSMERRHRTGPPIIPVSTTESSSCASLLKGQR